MKPVISNLTFWTRKVCECDLLRISNADKKCKFQIGPCYIFKGQYMVKCRFKSHIFFISYQIKISIYIHSTKSFYSLFCMKFGFILFNE